MANNNQNTNTNITGQQLNGGCASTSSPSSIEMQIDNFLEQFKRSASKAIEGEWAAVAAAAVSSTNNIQQSTTTTATTQQTMIAAASSTALTTTTAAATTQGGVPIQPKLIRSRSRASCFDISHLSDDPDSGSGSESHTVGGVGGLHQSHHHIFQHQSSVTSSSSVQTVLHQSIHGGLIGPNSTPASLTNSCQSAAGILQCSSGSYTSLNNGQNVNKQLQQPQQNHSNSSNVSSAEEPLCVGDVADLLHPQYAIITGGRSREGCPLITFPDHNNFQTLSDIDYQRLILYLTSVPSLQEADLGFHLIIDRRKDRWASVKGVLLKISVYFPNVVHVVYVLRPSGFFQKAISEVSSKLFKDEFRFRLIVCSTLDDLYEHIEKSQLTLDMGGELTYSHHEWIQQRISLEKFSSLTHQVSCNLDEFMRLIHDTEFPNSVESTQKLLDEQGGDYERLKDEILSAAKHGESLLDDINKNHNNKDNEFGKEFAERTGNVSSIERRDYRRLLVQLEETERRFDEFWNAHLTRLKQCLELRRFEQDFRELQTNFDSHVKTVTEMTEIGETVVRVDALIKELKLFHKICHTDIERAEEVISIGQQLISARGACPREVVQPKCDELLRVCEIVNERLTRRHDTLTKNRELMERIEKANKWCAKGIELLASQRIEKCSSSAEIAEQSLQEIQQFLSSASEFKLSSPREFRNVFLESTTPETKALVTQVLQRIDDVSLMCDKRVVSLKKLTLKPPRPVQQVTPEPAVPLQPPGGAPHPFRGRKTPQHKIDGLESPRPRSIEGPPDSGVSVSGDTTGSSPDSDNSAQHLQNQTDNESRRLKRGHVLAELLETERIYVAEMGSILKGYRDQMLSEDLAPLVPPGLQGKEDILFGNLNELYTFHSDIFLKDLENCISTTELVALCFVQRRDTFYRLYSYYCQNIPRSERLRETLVDTHLFLQECQRRLGHKLPLAAYLLKPVQRITKYQLLLKDLLRFSDNSTCGRELQKALDCMLIVLKCVNDSMHQIAITGFPADLSQQGELLLQDSFQVWTETKKDLRLRIKPQHRHIFLYQKAMLFCKQASKTGHNKNTYQFKHYLKMSQIGLTESVRGDPRRFEVWLQGRQEVHTIQATNVEGKNKWVSEIKRVLLNQLEELKGEKIKQYSLSHRQLRPTASWDTPMTAITPSHRSMSCDTGEVNRGSIISEDGLSGSSSGGGSIGGSIGGDVHITSNPVSNGNHKVITTAAGTNGTATVAPNIVGGTNGQTGISSSSSEHDNQEAGAWSSDYSNSEDEFTAIEDSVTPGSRFISLADYCAMGHSEVSMKEGDYVELLKVGCAGWWFVKVLGINMEGWAPAAYLESINKKSSSRCTSRSQDRLNLLDNLHQQQQQQLLL